MKHTAKTALVGAAVASTLISFAAPAAAATRTFEDAQGDINHGADLHSVKVVNEKSVRVVLRTEDLVRTYKSGAGVKVYFDTDRTDAGPEFVFLGGLFEGTDYALVRTEGWRPGQQHQTAVNKFHIMNLDYENDVARIRISRAALGRPGAVRVAVRTSGEQNDGDIVNDWLGERRELTSPVRRG